MTDAKVWVTEVHNFGGFFGGDTVTLTAVPWPSGDETTLTIDEKALANVGDRHLIAPEMLLQLDLVGERVDRARLLGARDRAVLRDALGTTPSIERTDAPRIRAYRCAACDLWVAGAPTDDSPQTCAICGQSIA